MNLKSNQIGIFHPCKLGVQDFTLFEIGDYGITLVLKLGLKDGGPRFQRTSSKGGGGTNLD